MKIIRFPTHWIGSAAITIFPFVFMDPGIVAGSIEYTHLLMHEGTHWQQQRRWAIYGLGIGLLLWWVLYLLVLPVGWNPWRRHWETEAYRAEGLLDSRIRETLRQAPYFLWW
jgi:hypothetical protein